MALPPRRQLTRLGPYRLGRLRFDDLLPDRLLAKDPVIATSPAYHNHPAQRLLLRVPDTISGGRVLLAETMDEVSSQGTRFRLGRRCSEIP